MYEGFVCKNRDRLFDVFSFKMFVAFLNNNQTGLCFMNSLCLFLQINSLLKHNRFKVTNFTEIIE